MERRVRSWVLAALFIVLAGCGLFRTASPPIYQDESLTVRVEPDPEGAAATSPDTDARNVTADQLAVILSGFKASKRRGILQSLLASSQPEPVFRADEVRRVAMALRSGFRTALPGDRVAFQLARTGGMEGREETRGAVYWRGPLLHMALTQFRSPNHVSSDSPEEGFDLSYEPADAVVQQERGSGRQRLGRQPAEIAVNIQRFKEPPVVSEPEAAPARKAESPAAPAGRTTDAAGAFQAVPTPAPRPDLVESLQRQIKELKDSNDELRAKLQELRNLRNQREDLDQLRRELAETKQVLADKVLELSRMKSRAGGSTKGKSQGSPGR